MSKGFIALEPRIMFDAAGAATIVETTTEAIDTTTLDAPLAISPDVQEALSVLARHEIAFVDAGVRDYQSLIDGISSNVDVYVVESSADGIAYMASVLENLNDIDAVHVLGHGSEASITLGSTVLSQENLASYTQALTTIGNALDETGDMLLYGCYVGSGEGEAFIQNLADITKADIAASNDLTGSVELGGDWDLEIVSGSVETEGIMVDAYAGSLGVNPYIRGIESSSVNEDGTLSITGISVTDGDSANITVSIASSHGNLSLTNSSGIAVSGSGTHTIELYGSPTSVNASLATLRYSPDANYSGSDALTIQAKDESNVWQTYKIDQTGKFYNPDNGHYYEYVSASGITWENARVAASNRTLYGLTGYLVTVTSSAENTFIAPKLGGEGWMGASDASSEGVWKWVTGPEANSQFWSDNTNNTDTVAETTQGSVVGGMYNNWASGEPNDWGGEEDHAHFLSSGQWNDYTYNNGSISGYVVEYGGLGAETVQNAYLTITVNAVNDTPVANASSFSTNEDTAYSGTLSVTDIDSSSFTYSVFSSPSHGSVTITNATTGAYTYTPSSNYNGSDSFSFRVYDGSTYSTNATVTVTVNAINDAPLGTVSSGTTNEDTSYSGMLSATDVDSASSSFTYSIASGPSHGTVTITNATTGAYTYTPTTDYSGSDSFSFTVSDGALSSTSKTVTMTITAVNDSPTFSSLTGISYTDTSALNTFTATTGTASASDIDSTLVYSILGTGVVDNSITASLAGTYGTLTLTKSTGAYTYTPNAGAINALDTTVTETFTLQASDGSLSATQGLTITLNGANDAPVFGEIAQNDTGTTQIADGGTVPSAAIEVLNNGLLKFGNGSIDSVNATTGMLEQPWYYKDGAWYKLTYSSYMLNFAIAAEGDGTNIWNLNGAVNMSPSFTTATVDNSGFVANGGYGTIVYTGYITVGSTDLKVAQVYTLSQTGSFVKVTTQVTNMEATATATNLRIWIGTQDDWVGNTDQPTKVKGNIVNGEFVAISSATASASAIKIYSGDSAVLFYSTSDNVNTSISTCCDFSNATNQSPCTSATTLTGDGSYAMFLRLDDLAPGASQSLDWYYAAGATNEIASIVSSVAQAAAVGLSESNQGELTSSGSYPVSDIDTGNSVTATLVSVGALQQTSSGTTLTSSAFQPSNADLMAMLSINPTAVIDSAHTSGTLNWAFNSGTQTFDYLKAGEKLVLTYTLRATDSSTATADQTVTITINGTNDAPIHTMPSSQSINEDGTLTLSTANSNAISLGITDDETITTTLSVSGVAGTLHVNTIEGTTISNNNSSSVQIIGSRAQINAALDGLVYTPTANANGTASLQIVSSDGNSSDTDTVTINVTAVDDLPTATSMAATVGPTSKQLFSYFVPTFSDVDAQSPVAIQITSLPTIGTFEVYAGSGDRGDDSNWITISSTSVPFVVSMSEMGNYRFNAGEATNDGTTAVVTWKVQTAGNTTSTGWSNEASGAISILNYTSNITPTVSITYPAGTAMTGEPQSTTQEFPNATTPVSSITTTASGKVVTINEDAQTATITLTYRDTITPSQFMQGLMQSSDTDLIDFSDASCYTMSQTVNGSGEGVVTLVLKPKANMYGETTITLGANDGQKTTAESFTLKILPINETPVAQDFLRTIAEDQPFYFNAINPAEIYTDSFDTNANANHQVNYNAQMAIIMAAQQEGATTEQQNAAGVAIQALVDANYFPKAFVIETLPSHGALYLGETAIASVGTSVPINQLSILTYRPSLNYYGDDSFQWYGVDQAPDGTDGIRSLSKVASFTMAPVNDFPLIRGEEHVGSVTETNTAITIDGELNVVDVDPNDSVVLSVVGVNVDATSTFTGTNPLTSSQMQAMLSIIDTEVDANPDSGSTFGWRFTSGNNGHESFDFLALGETLVLKYTIRSTDDSGINTSIDDQIITITIAGTNDTPVAQADSANALESGGLFNSSLGHNAVGNVLTNDSDVDTTDTRFVVSVAHASGNSRNFGEVLQGTYGSLTLQRDGSFVYIIDERNTTVEALRTSQTIDDIFTYTMSDNNNAQTTARLVITIDGAEDTPPPTPEAEADVTDTSSSSPVSVEVSTNTTTINPLSTTQVASVPTGFQGGLQVLNVQQIQQVESSFKPTQSLQPTNEPSLSAPTQTRGTQEGVGSQMGANGLRPAAVSLESNPAMQDASSNGMSLRLAAPLEPQQMVFGERVSYVIPKGTFVEIDPKATVQLEARLPNGAILPDWVSFDPIAGKFTFDLSKTDQKVIEIKVIAKNSNGVEVETLLRIDVKEHKEIQETSQIHSMDEERLALLEGKLSLSEQFAKAKAKQTQEPFEQMLEWLETFLEENQNVTDKQVSA